MNGRKAVASPWGRGGSSAAIGNAAITGPKNRVGVHGNGLVLHLMQVNVADVAPNSADVADVGASGNVRRIRRDLHLGRARKKRDNAAGAQGRQGRDERGSDDEIHRHLDSGQMGFAFGAVDSGGGVSKNPAVGMGVNSGGTGRGVEHPVENNAVSTR